MREQLIFWNDDNNALKIFSFFFGLGHKQNYLLNKIALAMNIFWYTYNLNYYVNGLEWWCIIFDDWHLKTEIYQQNKDQLISYASGYSLRWNHSHKTTSEIRKGKDFFVWIKFIYSCYLTYYLPHTNGGWRDLEL